MYLAQRARISWLKNGDNNTKFFHVRASYRNKKNRIEKLKNVMGEWVSDKDGVGDVILTYFKGLFSTVCTNLLADILEKIPRSLNEDMRQSFDKTVSDKEILDAFGQMDPRKAHGIVL